MPAGGLEPGAVAGALAGAGQVVHALTRYLDDLVGADEVEAVLGQGVGGARRAAAHAREALAMAAASLGWAGEALSAAGAGAELVAELGEAAEVMSAGRDLLATHVAVGDSGERVVVSAWSAAVASEPVAWALADQVRTLGSLPRLRGGLIFWRG